MESNDNQFESVESQVSNISLRQLNEERLKSLNKRFDEQPAANLSSQLSQPPAGSSNQEQPPAFQNFQGSVPDENKHATPAGTVQNIQRKFSTSWLNMQNFLGERKQNRDWDTKFK